MSEITERHIFDEAVRSIVRNDNSELTQIIDDVEEYLLVGISERHDNTEYKDTQAFIAETVVEYEDAINRVASQIRENMEWSLGLAWSVIQAARGTNG